DSHICVQRRRTEPESECSDPTRSQWKHHLLPVNRGGYLTDQLGTSTGRADLPGQQRDSDFLLREQSMRHLWCRSKTKDSLRNKLEFQCAAGVNTHHVTADRLCRKP